MGALRFKLGSPQLALGVVGMLLFCIRVISQIKAQTICRQAVPKVAAFAIHYRCLFAHDYSPLKRLICDVG